MASKEDLQKSLGWSADYMNLLAIQNQVDAFVLRLASLRGASVLRNETAVSASVEREFAKQTEELKRHVRQHVLRALWRARYMAESEDSSVDPSSDMHIDGLYRGLAFVAFSPLLLTGEGDCAEVVNELFVITYGDAYALYKRGAMIRMYSARSKQHVDLYPHTLPLRVIAAGHEWEYSHQAKTEPVVRIIGVDTSKVVSPLAHCLTANTRSWFFNKAGISRLP